MQEEKKDAPVALDYDHRLITDYAVNLARRTLFPSEKAREFMEEMVSGDSFADLRACADVAPQFRALTEAQEDENHFGEKCYDKKHWRRLRKAPRQPVFLQPDALHDKEHWRMLRKALDRLQAVTERIPPNLLARRCRELGRLLDLTDEDIRVLEFCLFLEYSPTVGKLLDWKREWRCVRADDRQISQMIGLSRNQLRRRFDPNAPLVRKGLLDVDADMGVHSLDCLVYLYQDTNENANVRDLLLGRAQATTELDWSDFEYLGQGRDDLEAVLRGAMTDREQKKGVNLLLYGPPGTGKTTLAKVLAQRLELPLFSVGESDDQGRALESCDRLNKLCFTQNLLEEGRNALLLLDEMDDVLTDNVGSFLSLFKVSRQGGRNGESRVWLHRLLENNPAPTIWITNHADSIDPAILRRMAFVLELRPPPVQARARVWFRQLERHGVGASTEETQLLAEAFEAPPGVAEGAVVAGKLGGGDLELVRRNVARMARLLGCDRPRVRGAVDFDLALIRADTDPVDLAERLVGGGERRFSLCLQGPPGTGKSAYARYLAGRLGLEVLHKRASDLMSCWVGDTEKNIAGAFAEARDSGAFLIFDEADSLLGSREYAQRSWEVSQVNEMLTWMESHPLPFACTTNYGERLDSATLRRFVFKVTLDYLDKDQARAAFLGWFDMTPPPELDALDMLTPGDFEVVRRKARVLGQMTDAAALVAMLRAECEAKPGHRAPIGFVTGSC